MKSDLATTILVAAVGAVGSFFICGLFLPKLNDVSYKTIETSIKSTVENPNNEVFNSTALNPTVEVCVGDCKEGNSEIIEEEVEEKVEEEGKEETVVEEVEEEKTEENESEKDNEGDEKPVEEEENGATD